MAHGSIPVEPVLDPATENEPAGTVIHAVIPEFAVYVPAEQTVTVVAPAAETIEPGYAERQVEKPVPSE